MNFDRETSGFMLVASGQAVSIYTDKSDYAGVMRAAGDLAKDVQRVSGLLPDSNSDSIKSASRTAVIVGTLGHNQLIDQLVRSGKLHTEDLRGKWEAFATETISNPFPGLDEALIIVGSDKRGTIYGVYDLSEQIGVSPWYWWADVPTTHHDSISVRRGRYLSKEPVVKYRGIFLNDEAPALSGWAAEKFGGFNHEFYAHVFELILRLKGNYLWPAMWGSAFNDDDKLNPVLADEYGIVMGTSHHEPLMRAHDEWRRFGKGPWDYNTNAETLRKFWRGGLERVRAYESIVSIGMRGDGDEAMSEDTNISLLERIVADQREIIGEVTGKKPAEVPQLWALYKEVQKYYEGGMRVPDDVTLLWCDDNWGNIRRLPTPNEKRRLGGAGVYYHVDYVGGPRNYKWLNTVPISKIWEQLHLAWQYEANRIWILNVGDLKPMEFPIEFFLAYAWDPSAWPYEKIGEFTKKWAAREFGGRHSDDIASIVEGYTKLNGRRKPEQLTPTTYSLINYNEAERVLTEWSNLVVRAERIYEEIPESYRPAFFELVLYPVKASANLQSLYCAAGRNQLYTKQGRPDANLAADEVRKAFREDAELAEAYHSLKNGKWNHMMSQVKLGYTTWQQPELETMPAVSEVRPRAGAAMGVALEGSEAVSPSYAVKQPVLPPLNDLTKNSVWLEVFNRGTEPFEFSIVSNQPWIRLSQSRGTVGRTARVTVSADWAAVPAGNSWATLEVARKGAEKIQVRLPVQARDDSVPDGFAGFVECNEDIAIEAHHYSNAVSGRSARWEALPGFGRNNGAVTVFPVTAEEVKPGLDTPRLEYNIYTFSSGDVDLELDCAPSLDFQGGGGLRLAISIDDEAPRIIALNTSETNRTWEKAVSDGVQKVYSRHRIERPGSHVIKLWMVTPGVVVQRLILDFGGVRPSYLGPPESPRFGAGRGRVAAGPRG
ncbi:MAG TPA: glycosyl hydrolase 115 family protein [Opitutaceae bacterium]|nr:glycosyl hydrolase 115 family protein [Opitutaceae bacterium]